MSTIQADPLFASQTNTVHQETLLSFFLSLDFQMVLPTHKLSEVIQLKPDVIAAISGMHAAVIGVCSLQDEVVWLVDLPYLLGLGASLKSNPVATECTLLKVKTQQGNLGILVRQVGRILDSNPEKLQFQADQTEWMAKLTQQGINPKRVKRLGYLVKGLWLDSEGKTLPVLDVEAMVRYLNQRGASRIRPIAKNSIIKNSMAKNLS